MLKTLIMSCLLVFSLSLYAADSAEKPQNAAPVVAENNTLGQETYEHFCIVCHRDGLAGAPKFRSDEWDARMKQKTMDELVDSVINGLNAMPAQGTCSECSDEDLKDAVLYMLPTHHD